MSVASELVEELVDLERACDGLDGDVRLVAEGEAKEGLVK